MAQPQLQEAEQRGEAVAELQRGQHAAHSPGPRLYNAGHGGREAAGHEVHNNDWVVVSCQAISSVCFIQDGTNVKMTSVLCLFLVFTRKLLLDKIALQLRVFLS